MALKPKNYAHVSLFAEHVAPVVSTLLVDVLILGLLFVSFQYVQMALASDFGQFFRQPFHRPLHERLRSG